MRSAKSVGRIIGMLLFVQLAGLIEPFVLLLHFTAIPLRGLLGYSLVTPLGVPMAFSHIALALWLTTKGVTEPERERPGRRINLNRTRSIRLAVLYLSVGRFTGAIICETMIAAINRWALFQTSAAPTISASTRTLGERT